MASRCCAMTSSSSVSSRRSACAPWRSGSASLDTVSSISAARWPMPSSSSRSTRLVASACCRRCSCARWSRRIASMRPFERVDAAGRCRTRPGVRVRRAPATASPAVPRRRRPAAGGRSATTSRSSGGRRPGRAQERGRGHGFGGGGTWTATCYRMRCASHRGGDGVTRGGHQVGRTRTVGDGDLAEAGFAGQFGQPLAGGDHARGAQALQRRRRQRRQRLLQRLAARTARARPGHASAAKRSTAGRDGATASRSYTSARITCAPRACSEGTSTPRPPGAVTKPIALPATSASPGSDSNPSLSMRDGAWTRSTPARRSAAAVPAPTANHCRSGCGRNGCNARAARTATGLVNSTRGASRAAARAARVAASSRRRRRHRRQRDRAGTGAGGGAAQRRVLAARTQRDHVPSGRRTSGHATSIAAAPASAVHPPSRNEPRSTRRRAAPRSHARSRRCAASPARALPVDAAGGGHGRHRRRLRRPAPAPARAAVHARERQGHARSAAASRR